MSIFSPDDVTKAIITRRRAARRGEGFLVTWSRSILLEGVSSETIRKIKTKSTKLLNEISTAVVKRRRPSSVERT